MAIEFKTTAEIPVPEKLIDQVIGQEKAVEIIKKAAKQKRHALLIGSPGTGKSMLAQAMAELMQDEALEDVLAYPNQNNENQPRIRVVRTFPDSEYIKKNGLMRYFTSNELERLKKAKKEDIRKILINGTGRRIVNHRKEEDETRGISPTLILVIVGIILIYVLLGTNLSQDQKWLILAAVFVFGILYAIITASAGLNKRFSPKDQPASPKLIIDNTDRKCAPFIDATGSRAGALLGDVKHDPLQSGGLGTAPHLRVEAGAVHQANNGVLFIDEIASLKINWQQEILTAMQEKKYPITGQSENSSGALVKTQPVPTDFVLVAAGNVPDIQTIHPALRSRIRGAGYEVYVDDYMEDTPENEDKLVRFVAQEIKKDGRVPPFARDAVQEIIEEARRIAGRKKKFTLNLRELGGLVRAAGDVAYEKKLIVVTKAEVIEAKKSFKSIESQIGAKMIEMRKDYQTIKNSGQEIGRVNGLAVLGDSRTGFVLPIVAEATPAASKNEGRVIATGKLGTIAKEAVENVSAIFKKYIGNDISKTDLHIQFIQTHEGLEGDSASISIAVAVISAISNIAVRQTVAMTGSLDVRGNVLPVGGVTAKIEAAVEAGITMGLIPKANSEDLYLSKDIAAKIQIVNVSTLNEVLEQALEDCSAKKQLLKNMSTKGSLNATSETN